MSLNRMLSLNRLQPLQAMSGTTAPVPPPGSFFRVTVANLFRITVAALQRITNG